MGKASLKRKRKADKFALNCLLRHLARLDLPGAAERIEMVRQLEPGQWERVRRAIGFHRRDPAVDLLTLRKKWRETRQHLMRRRLADPTRRRKAVEA